MSSLGSLTFFLSLVCLAAGFRLPLREGITVNSILTSPILDDLASIDLAGRMDGMVQNVTAYIVDSTDWEMANELFIVPFKMGFNKKAVKAPSSNVSTIAPQLTGIMSVVVYEPLEQFRRDVAYLITSAMEIVVQMPKWLDTTALMKVDLGTLDVTLENLLSVISQVIKVPKSDSEKIAMLYSKAAKLFPAHCSNLGSRMSTVISEIDFTNMLSIFFKILPESLVSYYPMITVLISSNMNSVYPMLSHVLPYVSTMNM